MEGHSSAAELLRARALWLELLEASGAQRLARLRALSCRTSEVLLSYAQQQLRGAPVVATESCGAGLLAAEGAPDAKRPRLGLEGRCLARGSRAHIFLQRLKVCTGASEDLSEAINWHILLVRVKQMWLDGTMKPPFQGRTPSKSLERHVNM